MDTFLTNVTKDCPPNNLTINIIELNLTINNSAQVKKIKRKKYMKKKHTVNKYQKTNKRLLNNHLQHN